MKLRVFFLMVFFYTASCCTKKDCSGFEDSNQLYFSGFTANEIDTLVIQRFRKNTNFTQRIDSIYFVPARVYDEAPNLMVLMPNKYAIDIDYKISLANNSTYNITNIETNKISCNNCPLQDGDLYYVLHSFKVNNNNYANIPITITK